MINNLSDQKIHRHFSVTKITRLMYKSQSTIFMIALTLGVIRAVLGISNLHITFIKFFTYISLTLLVLKILIPTYRKKELFVMVILLVLASAVSGITHDNTVFISMITILASKGVHFDKIVRVAFFSTLSTSLAVLLCTFTGVISNNTFLIPRANYTLARYSFGFEHPNMLHAVFAILSILLLYLEYDKHIIITIFFIAIVNVLLYFFTRSRTGLIAVFFALITLILYKKSNQKRLSMLISMFVVIALSAFQIFITIMYGLNFDFLNKLNSLFQGRILQANYYLLTYKLHLLGIYIPDLTRTSFHYYFDFAYMKIIVNYGIIFFVVYAFANIKTMITLINEKQQKEMFMLTSFIFIGFSENYILYIFLNVSMILFTNIIFKKNLWE